jgi:hypothetical protein
MKSRHEALAAFWHAQAASVGLTTDAGVRAQQLATMHGQRAERLTVTMLDTARVLAEQDRRRQRTATQADLRKRLLSPTPSPTAHSRPAVVVDAPVVVDEPEEPKT